MRSTARTDDEARLINAFSQRFSGPLFPWALVQAEYDPRLQRLLQEGIERRWAKEQGKRIEPLPLSQSREDAL